MSGITGNYTPFVPQVNTLGTQGTQGAEGVTKETRSRSVPPPNGASMLTGDAYVPPGNSAGFNPKLVSEDMYSANRISFNINNVLILIAQTMMESRKDQRAAWMQEAQNILATGAATANQMKQAAAWKLGGALASAAVSAAQAGVSFGMAAHQLKANAAANAKVNADLDQAGIKLEKVDTKAASQSVDADIDVQAQAQKIVADNPGLELTDASKPANDAKTSSATAASDGSGAASTTDVDQAAVKNQQAESKTKLEDTSKQLDERSVSDKTLEAEAKATETKAVESRDQIKDKQLEVDTKKEAIKVVEDNPDLALEEGADKSKLNTDGKANESKSKEMSNQEKIENNKKYYELKGALMRDAMAKTDALAQRNNAIASVLKAGVDMVAAGAQNMADVINADVELLRAKRDYQSQLASVQLDFANEARDLLNKTLDMMQSIEAARHKATSAINNV